ncbi:MAG: arsenic resistance N-acetyltransferase ArsN2 [Pseudomonadota bacterium]
MKIFTAPDRQDVHRLLAAAQLPADDVAKLDLQHFLGCGEATRVQGIIGVEPLGDVGLLRSLVVAADARAHGYGQQLVQHLEQHAIEHGMHSLYLLTNTAETFFARMGYAPIARDSVPAPVQATREFSQLCPDTATVMVKRLR